MHPNLNNCLVGRVQVLPSRNPNKGKVIFCNFLPFSKIIVELLAELRETCKAIEKHFSSGGDVRVR